MTDLEKKIWVYLIQKGTTAPLNHKGYIFIPNSYLELEFSENFGSQDIDWKSMKSVDEDWDEGLSENILYGIIKFTNGKSFQIVHNPQSYLDFVKVIDEIEIPDW